MDLYADNILDHYKHPRGTGSLPNPTVTHREENLSCGDDLSIDLLMKNGRIKDVAWRGEGCAISQAAMSILFEELIGKTAKDIVEMKPADIHALLGVPVGPRRFKCALLCLHALKNALRKAEERSPQSWLETVSIDH